MPDWTREVWDLPVWFWLAGRYERRAVRDASLVIANTDAVTARMSATYPEWSDRFFTVMNGCDDETLPRSSGAGRFVATYAGGIYLDRDPRPLFRAVGLFVSRRQLDPIHFGIELIGDVKHYAGVPVEQLAGEAGVADYVRVCPPVPREQLLERLAASPLLISLAQDSPWAIPSKIFEYMQFNAWLLVMAEHDSPVESLLRNSDADVVRPDDARAP